MAEKLMTAFGEITFKRPLAELFTEQQLKRHAAKKTGKSKRGGKIKPLSMVDRMVALANKVRRRSLAKAASKVRAAQMMEARGPVDLRTEKKKRKMRLPTPARVIVRQYAVDKTGAPVPMPIHIDRECRKGSGVLGVFSRQYQNRSVYMPHGATR